MFFRDGFRPGFDDLARDQFSTLDLGVGATEFLQQPRVVVEGFLDGLDDDAPGCFAEAFRLLVQASAFGGACNRTYVTSRAVL